MKHLLRVGPAAIFLTLLLAASVALSAPVGGAAPAPADAPALVAAGAPMAGNLIAPGDALRISVFQNPDLTLETRVDGDGTISYPLIGRVEVAGLDIAAAEQRIAKMLRDGGYINAPHVTIVMVEVRGSLVTVLGMVAKPGRFPIDATDNKLTDAIALAGGIAPGGSDLVVLTGTRNGKPIRREIDLEGLATGGDAGEDLRLQAGDMVYVNRAPNFFIYGEVQRPGAFRLERGMTVVQALATGGGLTPKGTQRGLTIHRRGANGVIAVIEPAMDDPVRADDVIYVKESLF